MNLLDLSLVSPEENLALDEALLDEAEAGRFSGALRFWESKRIFVVLGYSRKAAEDVRLEACQTSGVPVLRRASGGGTVLQGPGCLNFTLILPMEISPQLKTIRSTNDWVLSKMAAALTPVAAGAAHRGISDLAIGDRKFSGTAQRRKKSHILFHGTLLLNFDLAQVETYLRMPPEKDEPDYRRHRTHGDFLTCLEAPAQTVKSCIAEAWQASSSASDYPRSAVDRLVFERYRLPDWNFKY